MKLTKIAAKPQLVKVELDDEEIQAEFGESLEFWTWDRQPLDTFMKLANAEKNNFGNVVDVIRTLILDEDGRQVISDDVVLPSGVMIKVIGKVVELLGK